MAQQLGFDFVDIKHCHGYLGHEFLSAHTREGKYGGSFENRTRFLRECVAAVRRALPEPSLLFVRISATDWTDGGWDIDQSVELARRLKTIGADVIDCSSGGNVEKARFKTSVEDFYLSNPIARASAVMAECSRLASGQMLTAAE